MLKTSVFVVYSPHLSQLILAHLTFKSCCFRSIKRMIKNRSFHTKTQMVYSAYFCYILFSVFIKNKISCCFVKKNVEHKCSSSELKTKLKDDMKLISRFNLNAHTPI